DVLGGECDRQVRVPALTAGQLKQNDMNVAALCAQRELWPSLVRGNLDPPRPAWKQAQRDPIGSQAAMEGQQHARRLHAQGAKYPVERLQTVRGERLRAEVCQDFELLPAE